MKEDTKPEVIIRLSDVQPRPGIPPGTFRVEMFVNGKRIIPGLYFSDGHRQNAVQLITDTLDCFGVRPIEIDMG